MKKSLAAIIMILMIIAGVKVYHLNFQEKDQIKELIISGNIEITEIALSFKIAGRLAKRYVDEGDTVEAGQIIARLDGVDQELAVERAEAKVAYSEAVLAELVKGSRLQEIADAKAEMKRARAAAEVIYAELKLASADLKRFAKLYEEGGISFREYETRKTKYQVKRSSYDEANARVKSAEELLSLRREGSRTEKIEQGRAQLAIDKAALQQAKQQLAYTNIASPVPGVVLSKCSESGEYLNPGSPVVTVGNLNKVWLRAYVREVDLGKIKLNQKVTVSIDTYPNKPYAGKISYISSTAEFTPKAVQTTEERTKLVYRIKIDLDNPENELKPGMPADAVITLEP